MIRRLPGRRFSALIGALSFAGILSCDQQVESRESGNQPSVGEIERFVLVEEPVARIGGRDERPDYQIQFTSGALRLSDGRIVIADDGSREIRYFDRQGRHLSTVGGLGSGPGEFQRLRTIARLSGDTVLAWDLIQRRINVFSPEGGLRATTSIPAVEGIQTDVQRRDPSRVVSGSTIHPLRAGRFVVQPQVAFNPEEVGRRTAVIQDTLSLFVVDSSGIGWIELGPFPGAEWFFHDGTGSLLAFGENLRVATGDEVIYIGSTRNATIQVVSGTTGEVVGSIVLPLDARLPSAEDIAQYRARRIEDVRPDRRGGMIAYVDAIPWPASMPIFSELRVAADGRVWVQVYPTPSDTTQEWLIFEPSGNQVASLTMDTSAQLLDAGSDNVLVRVTDAFDLQEIRVHDLERERSEQ